MPDPGRMKSAQTGKTSIMSQPYNRVYNFSAGPCTLPVEVLEEAKEGLLNYKGVGMSVMEMSHRSKAYEAIIAETEASLRDLLSVPEDYRVLFLQGGASLQFTMLAMNFLRGGVADYITTGTWGSKAVESAALEGKANQIYTAKATNFDRLPTKSDLSFTPNANYVHFTSNETIQGVQYKEDPAYPGTIICDMSSDILARNVDVSKYAMIYAGAQKNMGPAGATVVLIRDEMIEKVPSGLSPMLDYRVQAENGSMYNTPPCWTIYMCGLVYKWVAKLGGIDAMQKQNEQKSALLYSTVDRSNGFYKGHAVEPVRSTMNVTFTLPDEDLTKAFIKESEAAGFDGLKGHRSVGGIRASIYNAFPVQGCADLAAFMGDFASRNG